jgi:hypothetical protein
MDPSMAVSLYLMNKRITIGRTITVRHARTPTSGMPHHPQANGRRHLNPIQGRG